MLLFFYGEDGQTPAQVVQRTRGIPILGDIQALTELGPEQLALGDPALRRGVRQDDFQRLLPTSVAPSNLSGSRIQRFSYYDT